MSLAGIQYEVLEHTQDLTEQNQLYYVERLIAEVNTNDNDVTPSLYFNGTAVAYTALNTATRQFVQTTVERLGPLTSVQLAMSDFSSSNLGLYSLELHIRPVELKLNLITMGQTVQLAGRSVDPATSITFDINPHEFPENARFITPLPRRLYIDIKSAANVTPVLVEDDGTETNLTAINQAGRAIVEFAILTGKRLKSLRLDGDFSVAGTVLYDIVLDTYVPGNRKLSVG